MPNLIFDAPKGQRVMSEYHGITVMNGPVRWWIERERKWSEEIAGRDAGSHAPCRTVKAFKRHLRKHAADLAGCEVVLVSRFVGQNVKWIG